MPGSPLRKSGRGVSEYSSSPILLSTATVRLQVPRRGGWDAGGPYRAVAQTVTRMMHPDTTGCSDGSARAVYDIDSDKYERKPKEHVKCITC